MTSARVKGYSQTSVSHLVLKPLFLFFSSFLHFQMCFGFHFECLQRESDYPEFDWLAGFQRSSELSNAATASAASVRVPSQTSRGWQSTVDRNEKKDAKVSC